MRLTVLGGRGAWPDAGQACSGYLVEHEGFRLLIDPGYATLPRLLERVTAGEIDAVFVTHGHPDHCADVNPLLRARRLTETPAAPLPLFAPPGALRAVLAMDRPGLLDPAYDLHEFAPGDHLEIGPFGAETRLLPHMLPNAGVRLVADDQVIVYTGDTGPSPDLVPLARGADLLLSESSYVDHVPDDSRAHLFSADQAGQLATDADVGHLLLAHLLPGTDSEAALAAATECFGGPIGIASGGVVVEVR